MQYLKNIFAPIGAVLGFINKYFKSLIFLLILFLIFAGGEGTQQKGANLAQLSLSGAIMDDSEILEKIVDKTIGELESQLKNVKISLNKEAKDLIISRGYSDEFGARNLKREISSQISDHISGELLFGALQEGGLVSVSVKDGELSFSFASTPLPQIEKKQPALAQSSVVK